MSRHNVPGSPDLTFAAVRNGVVPAAAVRPGMRLLLTVLAEEPIAWPVEETEFHAALALARTEHVLPWFLHRLKAASSGLSPALHAQLAGLSREIAITAFFWCGELKTLLLAFAETGVPVLPLKGPALAERVYGDALLRSNRDLDLLVPRADLASARGLLHRLGFHPLGPGTYQQSWLRDGMMVELHDDVALAADFNFNIETAWQRAALSTFHGAPAWQFSPEDELLFLAIHAVRHELSTLSVLLDLALALRRLRSCDLTPARPGTSRLRRVLALVAHLAHQLQPGPLGGSPDAIEDDRLLRRWARRFETQLLGQPRPLRWHERHSLHRALEPAGWLRLRRSGYQLRLMLREMCLPSLAQRDFAFAARWGLTSAWQVRFVRPLRLLLQLWNRSSLPLEGEL